MFLGIIANTLGLIASVAGWVLFGGEFYALLTGINLVMVIVWVASQ